MSQIKEKIQLTNWEIVSVNPVDKNWNWRDYFCFWANNIQSLISFSLIASLYILYNLNFFVVLSGTLIASLLIYFLSNLIGLPSQRHGIPFVVFLRTSAGHSGAKYFGMIRGVVGIFFFGVQTYFISKSVGYLIRIFLFNLDQNFLQNEIFLIFYMGLNIIDWSSLIFTFVFQFFLFRKGHHFVKTFINFSGFFVYFGLFLFLIIIVSEHYIELRNSLTEVILLENIFLKSNISPLIAVTGTMFAYFSIIILNFGDFSRYASSENELKKGNLSLFLNIILFSILALLITLGADIVLKSNLISTERLLTNPTDIIGKINNTYLTIIALIFILVASLSTNLIANYIPSQNSLLNFLPKQLNLNSSGFIIILLGFLISMFWLPVLSQIGILSFLDTLGAFFGPIFGLMISDYYIISNKNIINKDIFSSNKESTYIFSNGWHIKAIYSVFIGFIFSSSTIWNLKLNFLQSFSWILGASVTFVIYYLLSSKTKTNE